MPLLACKNQIQEAALIKESCPTRGGRLIWGVWSMKKEIVLRTPFMNSNPYLSIFFSFVEVNRMTITWLLKFFTGAYAFTKYDDNEFDMQITGFVSANLLDDYFMICCPFVDICQISQKLILSDIKSEIINAINNGYCIAIVINPQFINAYGNISLNEHDLLINGYDLKKDTLFVKDFFPPSYKFESHEIPYKEFLEAFSKRDTKYKLRFLMRRDVAIIPSSNDLKDVLIEVLKNIITKNYNVKNPYHPMAYKVYKDKAGMSMPVNNIWYGIDIYNGMLNYLDKISNKFWIMLSDSKKLIYYALTQLEDYYGKEPIHMYEEVLQNLKIILHLNIKCKLKKEEVIINRIKSLLCETRDIENKAIHIIVDDLLD